MISALAKAESLHKFAKAQGCPLAEFQLVLSDVEGLELLEWFVEQYARNEILSLDVEIAQRTRDPWPVLCEFELLGMHMVRASLVLN